MAHTLRDYLEIDADEALRQWRAVLTRDPPVEGRRQEPYRPIEVLLCYALFRVLDPRRFGGSNIHRLPDGVKALARTLCRSPGSLTNKMLNLSFDRAHGSKLEPELFLRLGAEPDRFLRLYLTILDAARAVGLGPDRVPDFVGTGDRVALLGQDELGDAELGIAWHEHRDDAEVGTLRTWLGETATERLVEQRVRLGQHRFAAAVLAAYDRRCGFCGFSPDGLGARGLLVASHIKPWAACDSDRERLDPRNGIAACPTHDKAFDGGLLTVNGGYRIHRARGLEARLADRVTESFFGPDIVGERLLLGRAAEGPGRRYLDYHRRHVFERAG
jgi:putative restriction endonuclease